MGNPPVSEGGLQDNRIVPDVGVTVSDLGSVGTSPGVSDIVATDPVPFAFVAPIVIVYRVPFVRPVYVTEPPILLMVIVGVGSVDPPTVATTE
jgi:hypothetical protein